MISQQTKSVFPRITFGMIVLNGEPFLRYNLRGLYPFAHQIIVVEGAARAAASVATHDGHSTDNTLRTLREFKEREDPDDKLIIVTAESEGHPDGFWPGEKHEQSQAYARRATGDYLWQVDVDEFYKPDDMRAVLELLRTTPSVTAVSFKMITFWGGFDYITDGWYLRRGAAIYHRLFKWAAGYQYTTHRPPTVVDTAGRNLRDVNWISGEHLAKKGILLYHYSLLFPKQVVDKCRYYGQAAWAGRTKAEQWATENFLLLRDPYRVHNVYDYPSWLERFTSSHPPQIEELRAAISAGRIPIRLRPTADIEWLLASRRYQLGRLHLQVLDYVERLNSYPEANIKTSSIQAPIPNTTARTDKPAQSVLGRVVVINTQDRGGGAERVAFELSQGLLQRGVDAQLLVGAKVTNADFVQPIPYLPGEKQCAYDLMQRTGFSDLVFPSSFRLGLQEPVHSAQVIHLHNLHGLYFSVLSLPWLSHLKPVVWTLHDMWSMTGNCAYSMECDRWLHACGNCPQLGAYPLTDRDHTRFHLRLKRILYRSSSLVIVTPSQWLKGLAEQSPLGHFPIVHIPNGIDTDIFRPSSKVAARAHLGLPQDRQLILILANWLKTPWKGVPGLLSALQETTWEAPVTLLLVGQGSEQLAAAHRSTLPVIARGYVKEAQELARYYAAADVFLHPSRADNLPFTVLEAMACGTPVIASRVGGIPEEIDDGHTGLTTPVDDHGAMIWAAKRLLSDAALCQALGQAGREKVLREFAFPRFIQRHIDLYQAVL